MAITLERLIEAYNTYKVKYEGRKEDYFAPLFISDKFDRLRPRWCSSPTSEINPVVAGGHVDWEY